VGDRKTGGRTMRQYELVTIFNSEEELFKLGKESVSAELAKHGAVIVKEDDMGDRELAYEIDRKKRGHYWLYTIEVAPDKIIQADRAFKLNTNLVKYLFVRKEA